MASLFHRSKQRRAERASITAHGNINLVPLVDILTSIVFFSLLTYTGAALAALTAFDLSLPPTVVTADDPRARGDANKLNLLLTVSIYADSLKVAHSEGLGQRIEGLGEPALGQLESVMKQVRAEFPQNSDVLIVPSDEVSYNDVVKVLERLRVAGFTGLSLGNRARGTAPAADAPAATPPATPAATPAAGRPR
jgi:biopolymer transport protein ExbD